MLENLFLTFGEIEYMTYFRSDIVHALQDVATWGPGQLNTFLKHYTSTLQTLYHSHPIIKRVISNCVHCRHYAIMTVDLTSGWKAHACGFDYFEVNFIRVRGRFASVQHCMAKQPPTIKMWKARSGHLRIWGDVWHQCNTGKSLILTAPYARQPYLIGKPWLHFLSYSCECIKAAMHPRQKSTLRGSGLWRRLHAFASKPYLIGLCSLPCLSVLPSFLVCLYCVPVSLLSLLFLVSTNDHMKNRER